MINSYIINNYITIHKGNMTNFNTNETQRINNYINNQISSGKGLDDWNIPTYGMFGIYTGIGY